MTTMFMSKKQVRVRFAPSPTGAPHVGNIRTALFAWLFARNQGGAFILRVEDTDQTRKEEGSLEAILESLDWLGLTVDEGVMAKGRRSKVEGLNSNLEIVEKGDKGPYFQSKRLDIYKEHAKILVDQGNAFYCFCSPERLEGVRQEQQAKKEPPRYDGHCLGLSEEESKDKLDAGKKHVIRMKIPEEGETFFEDVIKGKVSFKNSLIDHQVLLKSDGFPTYHLASVVDDNLMEVSHVIRADEWLASTPKHVLLYKYFGWSVPKWVHLPIILGKDKSKLSKRHGAVSVLDYKQDYLPDAMVNYLAFLGWNPKTDQEILSRAELIKQFDLDKINKNNPIFDVEKLNWINAQYIKKMDVKELGDAILPLRLPAEVEGGARYSGRRGHDRIKIVKLIQDRMEKLSDFEELTSFLRKLPDYEALILIPKKMNKKETLEMLKTSLGLALKLEDWEESSLRQTWLDYCEEKDTKRGDLLWPLRVAVTGLERSPDVFGSMDVLGKEESIKRINQAVKSLQ